MVYVWNNSQEAQIEDHHNFGYAPFVDNGEGLTKK